MRGQERAQPQPAAGQSPAQPTGAEAIPRLPFLLEVGSEEIPARFLPRAMAQFQSRSADLLTELHLAHGDLQVMATPRRLVLSCDDLAVQQPDRSLTVKGPPVAVAYTADGQPTAAASGFARKNRVELDDCVKLQDERGEYLAVRKIEPGQATVAVLAERLPEMVLGLTFPKVMRWGDGACEYPRPLQWIVALLGEEVVPVVLGDVEADRVSRGHRTLAANRSLVMTNPGDYLDTLGENGVVVDPTRRRRLIEEGLESALADLSEAVDWIRDEELLTEVVFLCEHPTVFVGEFSREYFALPDEVIITALKAHQRYFAVSNRDGHGLRPYFLAVRDGGTEFLDTVRHGNERVLRARLADALFYWQFDQQKTPDEHVARLAHVTWIEGFGTLLDKSQRLTGLVTVLWQGGFGDGGPVPAEALRAAAICKSDQVSEMIRDGKEFTRLEGIIGAHYARQAGESEVVCRAIETHYFPRTATDGLPDGPVSALLAAADRLDTLAGCWLAGFVPTGTKDPYGLRRQSLALLRVVLAGEHRIDLAGLLRQALAPFATYGDGRDLNTVAAELQAFIQTRMGGLLTDSKDCVPEVVRAILPAHGNDPTDALAWARALAGFRGQKDFQLLATGFKRCQNILEGKLLNVGELAACPDRWRRGGEGAHGESFDDLTEPAEVNLRDQVAAALPSLDTAEETGDYVSVFAQLSQFGPAIDTFFDSVRVNVADERLQRLRHAFLREIHGLFAHYADFLEVAPREE